MRPGDMTASHKRTMEEAIDLSDYLLEQLKPEHQRTRGHLLASDRY
jgi:hypothetical protein